LATAPYRANCLLTNDLRMASDARWRLAARGSGGPIGAWPAGPPRHPRRPAPRAPGVVPHTAVAPGDAERNHSKVPALEEDAKLDGAGSRGWASELDRRPAFW